MGSQTDGGTRWEYDLPDGCGGCGGVLQCECDDDEPGVCWCGAYGTYGKVHVAKPSPDEPPEECGRFL